MPQMLLFMCAHLNVCFKVPSLFLTKTQHKMRLVSLTLSYMFLSSVRSCIHDRCFLSQRDMEEMMSLSTGALYFVLLGCHKLYCQWRCQLASKQRLFKNQEGNRYCCLFFFFVLLSAPPPLRLTL